MKVIDIMTRNPLTIASSETVGQAEALLDENNIRQLPVIKGRELIGIVTDRDIRAFLSGSFYGEPEKLEKALRTPVGDIMTSAPIFVSPDDDLQEVVEVLIDEKVSAIPVVDEAEGLVGIVSYVDVLRCFLNRLLEE